MTYRLNAIAVCLALIARTGLAAADRKTYDFSDLRGVLKDAVNGKKVAGCSLLLIHHGKVVFREGYGLSDINAGKPFTPDTVVHLASSSKWISATAMMLLADDGKLSLDDPVGKYLPEFKDIPVKGTDRKANPTFRQCFSHIAGYPGQTKALDDQSITVQESARQISLQVPELVAMPGASFLYGGVSFQIAGAAIETITGKPFETFLRERVLTPLRMNETTFNPTGQLIDRAGPVYGPEKDGAFRVVLPPPAGHNRNCRIAGGLYGTLDDYGRFLQMQLAGGTLAGKRILSRESTLLMRTDQVHAAAIAYSPFKIAFPDEPTRYGFGTWLNSVDGHGVGISVSDGGAYGTRPWIDFDRDLIAVFFTQTPLRGIFRLVEKDVPNAVRAAIDRADIDRADIDKVKP